MTTINWQPVTSSHLSQVAYEDVTKTLYVEFEDGSQYSYADVPAHEYVALLSAPSVGKFFNAHIKNGYSATKVR